MLQIKIPQRSDEVLSTPKKKYMTKARLEEARQKKIKKNRFKGQQKAWDTRRGLYPETNGYKPIQVEDTPKVEPEKKVEVDVPSESVPKGHPRVTQGSPNPSKLKVRGKVVDVSSAELAEKLDNLDEFLNSVPGVKFNREEFIRDALTEAIQTLLSGIAVTVTGEKELTKKLKGMMEFVGVS
jgi:hypothetical protein